MKIKTMVKFLLCFFIISNVGIIINVAEATKCTECNNEIATGTGGIVYKNARDSKGKMMHYTCVPSTYDTSKSHSPSDGYFFSDNGGKTKVMRGFNTVDENLGPMIHIQSVIMLVGTLASVVVVGIYGIQWLMATPAKKQELKAALWPLVIGIVLLVIGPRLAIIIVNALL